MQRIWEMGLLNKRLNREQLTVEKMIDIYCRKNHGLLETRCPECEDLLAFAREKIQRCPFGENKPVCAKCEIHCYKQEMKEAIKKVMRFSGPRMIVKHPLLTLLHIKDSQRRK